MELLRIAYTVSRNKYSYAYENFPFCQTEDKAVVNKIHKYLHNTR
jgi:hypothetical protein